MVRRLVAPPIVDPRKDRLALRCEYDLHGNELYSVNWYRNEDVLFRYSPSLEPKATVYSSVVDVNVSLEHSNAEQLLLLGDRDVRKSRYWVLHNLTYLLVKCGEDEFFVFFQNNLMFMPRRPFVRRYVSVRGVHGEALPHRLRTGQRQRGDPAQEQSDPRRLPLQLPRGRTAPGRLHVGAQFASCRALLLPQRAQGSYHTFQVTFVILLFIPSGSSENFQTAGRSLANSAGHGGSLIQRRSFEHHAEAEHEAGKAPLLGRHFTTDVPGQTTETRGRA